MAGTVEFESLCIIEITFVSKCEYIGVTPEFAAAEGEGDKTLVWWRDAHWRFFSKECEELGIEPFMVYTDQKYNWDKVTEMYNTIKLTKPNEWWIITDDDELQVYPYDVKEIVKECESKGFTFVTGGFLDRIGANGTFPVVTKDMDIHKAFPLAGFFRYPMSGACPNKVTLCKGSQKITSGQHYALLVLQNIFQLLQKFYLSNLLQNDLHPLKLLVQLLAPFHILELM